MIRIECIIWPKWNKFGFHLKSSTWFQTSLSITSTFIHIFDLCLAVCLIIDTYFIDQLTNLIDLTTKQKLACMWVSMHVMNFGKSYKYEQLSICLARTGLSQHPINQNIRMRPNSWTAPHWSFLKLVF